MSLSIMQPQETTKTCDENYVQPDNDKNLLVQLVLSLLLGVTAFLAFCILRPRWPGLYAARKRRLHATIDLPTLSKSAFAWMPQLYKISEEQVLSTAGLDAFVFLTFFKMAARLFAVMAFFATVVLFPINKYYRGFTPVMGGGDGNDDTSTRVSPFASTQLPLANEDIYLFLEKGDDDKRHGIQYIWSYVFFTYLFVGLTIYFLNWETFRIIRLRQNYLGSQSTITDRTFRLTGIPSDIRSENQVKDLIEKLNIGTVEAVTICRDWRKLDDLVALRDVTLRKLEAFWTKYLKYKRDNNEGDTLWTPPRDYSSSSDSQGQQNDEEAAENGHFLNPEVNHIDWGDQGRPQVNLRYGFLGMRYRKVDAIDFYEERLRRLDEKIIEARKKKYAPTDMALVTMDSVASCQMFIQARIDPRPGRLLTKPTPAPSDLVWRNAYSPRGIRRLKSWAVTLFITLLTFVWIIPTAALASLLSMCAITQAAPKFADMLQRHDIVYSLVSNFLPTLVVSLLNVAVPYLYDWLSNCQGMISQGDVELSLISKNFFFTFFNTFFVFTISKTGLDFWAEVQKLMKDTSKIPSQIAGYLEGLSIFYICFIMLQGVGLMPFRILEVGSVFLYPFERMMSVTPRDFSELKKPPAFQYGFYLPTALLVFNLCLIYSVLKYGFIILITGTVFFTLGYFTYKYMLLYAMDQPQHATGGAWRIICYRIIIGLVVFETVMLGQIASIASLAAAFVPSLFIIPLVPFTIWYSYYIKQRFVPLTLHIALRAIRANGESEGEAISDDAFDDEGSPPSRRLLRRGSTLDEYREKDLKFVNPSLVAPLQQPWVYHDPPPNLPNDRTQTSDDQGPPILASIDSSLGIGESNVWRESGDNNV